MKYIDLGLPSGTLWGECPLGAKHPWDYGEFYCANDSKKFGLLPTVEQVEELFKYCKISPTKLRTHKVLRFVGPNNNSIYFTFSGIKYSAGGYCYSKGYSCCFIADSNVAYFPKAYKRFGNLIRRHIGFLYNICLVKNK